MTGNKEMSSNPPQTSHRVHLTYNLQLSEETRQIELPFVLGLVADFFGESTKCVSDLWERKLIDVELDNFDSLMKYFQPRLTFEIDFPGKTGDTQLPVELIFEKISDFEPLEVAARIELAGENHLSILNEIINTEPFQRLEATWRGMKYLLNQFESSEAIKIRMLNITKEELREDCAQAEDFRKTWLYRKVEEEYSMYGGQPFGAFLGDYTFNPTQEDMELLTTVGKVAEAMHAPFIAAPGALFFGDDSPDESQQYHMDSNRLRKVSEFSFWQNFRQDSGARFVALCWPRILLRLPYGPESWPLENLDFEEVIDKESQYLWGSAAYAFAARLLDSFATFGWGATIQGVETGGLVSDLPTRPFKSPESTVEYQSPTEINLMEMEDHELVQQGFIPLLWCKGENFAVFFSSHTTHTPPVYSDPDATISARMLSMMNYLMPVSRIVQYIKVLYRDSLEGLHQEACEKALNDWISDYVLPQKDVEDASPDLKARYPFASASIELKENEEALEYHLVKLRLKPHFQVVPPPVSFLLSFLLKKSRMQRRFWDKP